MVPPIGAVVISKRRRHIINTFRDAGAVSQETAKSLESIGLSDSLILEIQKLKGVIVKTENGYFYLYEKREREAARFRQVLMGLVLVIIVVIALYLNR